MFRSLKLKQCDIKVKSLCVEKFLCNKKIRSLKKKLGTEPGRTIAVCITTVYQHDATSKQLKIFIPPN